MKLIKYNWLFLLIFSLMACDPEEFFSPVIELDIPPHTSKLVVGADLEPNSDDLRIYLSKSYGFLDPKSQQWGTADTVAGAQVQLFKNEVLWATFAPTSNNYYVSSQKIPLNDRSTYRLQVSAPNYETVTATQMVPSTVPILKATFTSEGGVEPDGYKVDLYTIEFNDPANEENFYQAEASWKSTRPMPGWGNLDTFQLLHLASTGDNGNETMLTDKAFNGKTYKWLLKPYFAKMQPQAGDTLEIRLQPITKDRYLYNKSFTLYSNSEGNPFSEPVLLHTNLQKGYGNFTISGGVTKKIIVF